MNDKRHGDFLDDLLDAALPRHSWVEPRAGLEDRVVARMQEQPRSLIDFPLVRWSTVSLAVVALAVAGVLLLHRSSEISLRDVAVAPQPPATSSAVTATATSPAVKAVPAPLVRRPKSSSPSPPRTAPPVPRRQVFPTRTGISVQEQLLLAYVAETPPEILKGRLSPPTPLESTFRIEPIQIRPVVFKEILVEPLEFD